jgi:AcrR family transcriptional regulator
VTPAGIQRAEAPGSDPGGSARKRELLEAAYRYVLGNGLADMSLRPLAKAIGSSPRVLLFLFGSKEGLVRALLARAREDELGYLETLRNQLEPGGEGPGGEDPSGEDPGGAGLAATGAQVWSWLAAPEHRALLGLWVEGYALSLRGEPGPWAGFAASTVSDWLDLLADRQSASRGSTPDGQNERTLLLAVLRGALLDLLATGEVDRVTRAVESHLRTLTEGWQASDLGGEAGEQARRDAAQPVGVPGRPGDEHGALQAGDDHPGGFPGGGAEPQRAVLAPVLEDLFYPVLVRLEEGGHRLPHGRGQGLVLGCEHAAQAHPALLKYLVIEVRVRRQTPRGRQPRPVDGGQRPGEPARVPGDQRQTEIGFPGKVVVQRRLGDTHLGGDVGVAEAVVAAYLKQDLSGLQDASDRPRVVSRRTGSH